MKNNRISCFFISVICTISYPYFYCGGIFHHPFNKKQLIICLGDFHDQNHPANKKQQDDINLLLKICCAVKGKVIVEDLSSMNNDGKIVCCDHGIACNQGFLGQLASKARASGIPVDNIEYRYCRVAAFAPLLKNIQLDPYSFSSTKNIQIASIYREIIDEMHKIQKFNDAFKVNAFYYEILSHVQKNLNSLQFETKKDCSVAEYCSSFCFKKNYKEKLENLCIFDSGLIDINIIHSIVSDQKKSLIIVVAGGSHIEKVRDILKALEYRPLFFTSFSNLTPIDIHRFIQITQKNILF